MHNNQDLTLARAVRVLEERLRPAIHSRPHPLMIAAHRVGGEPIAVADGLAAEYAPTQPGEPWGRAWDTTWFRVTGQVPAEFAGERVEVLLDLGFDVNMTGFQAEGLVYRAVATAMNTSGQEIYLIGESPLGKRVVGRADLVDVIEGETVWGATSAILQDLARVLLA